MRILIWVPYSCSDSSGRGGCDAGIITRNSRRNNWAQCIFPCLSPRRRIHSKGCRASAFVLVRKVGEDFLASKSEDSELRHGVLGEPWNLWHQLWKSTLRPTIKRASAELKKSGNIKGGLLTRARLHPGSEGVLFQQQEPDHCARAMGLISVAMEKVYRNYPDDHESPAFFTALPRCWRPSRQRSRLFCLTAGAGAVLESLFRRRAQSSRSCSLPDPARQPPVGSTSACPAPRRYR